MGSNTSKLRNGYDVFLYAAKRLIGVFILCIVIRIFAFEIFAVPSNSMENTLLAQDYLLVSKIYFGPRLPKKIEEVPWLNIFSNGTNWDSSDYSANVRISGYSSIIRGDIMVFNHPVLQTDYYVKRCVAIPGDLVKFDSVSLFVNNNEEIIPIKAKQTYRVCFADKFNVKMFLDSLGVELSESWDQRRNPCKQLLLEQNAIEKIRANNNVLFCEKNNRYDSAALRYSDYFTLIDHDSLVKMSAFVVPYKGMVVSLNDESYSLFKEVINKYEKKRIEKRNGKFYFSDNSIAYQITFQHNYYYFVGDNRDYSIDSRSWGLVPEYCIVGKPLVVLFSSKNFARLCRSIF